MHNGSTATNQSLNKLNPQLYFENHTPLQKQSVDNEQNRSETTRGGTNALSKKLLSITRQEKQRNVDIRGGKKKETRTT
jgi:hypothetical protein